MFRWSSQLRQGVVVARNAGSVGNFGLVVSTTTTNHGPLVSLFRLWRSGNSNNNSNGNPWLSHPHQWRGIASATTPVHMPLEEFRDPVTRAQRQRERVGRPWRVVELRRKSFDDLHKLWIVLYKERNMLLTELQLSRRRSIIFPQRDRFKKVQKSMAGIKCVLGERKIAAIKAHAENRNVEAAIELERNPPPPPPPPEKPVERKFPDPQELAQWPQMPKKTPRKRPGLMPKGRPHWKPPIGLKQHANFEKARLRRKAKKKSPPPPRKKRHM